MIRKAGALGRVGPNLWWFAPAFLLSLVLFGALGWHVFNTFDVERQLKTQASGNEDARNRLCLFHQQLASNAVMVVASGDSRAEERQAELAAGLVDLVNEVRERAPAGYNLKALWEADQAQKGLREMEQRAFATAKQGQREAA